MPSAPTCCCLLAALAAGGSPFFRTPISSAKRQADTAMRGSTFFSVLLEFWVTDGDEPVPVAAAPGAATPAAQLPGAPMW